MLEGFADSSKYPTKVRNVMGQPPPFLVELLQTMSDPGMSTFLWDKILKEEKKRNF